MARFRATYALGPHQSAIRKVVPPRHETRHEHLAKLRSRKFNNSNYNLAYKALTQAHVIHNGKERPPCRRPSCGAAVAHDRGRSRRDARAGLLSADSALVVRRLGPLYA